MDEQEVERLDETAEREEEEARTLEMLADADEGASLTAGMASSDRAIARELEMEAEYLRKKAAERRQRSRVPGGPGLYRLGVGRRWSRTRAAA